MFIIFLVSSTSGDVINKSGLGKESYHVGGHFILFMFLCAAYFYATTKYFVSLLFLVLYSLFDEWHQLYVPGRSSSAFDLAIDTLGGITALLTIWILRSHLRMKQKNLQSL